MFLKLNNFGKTYRNICRIDTTGKWHATALNARTRTIEIFIFAPVPVAFLTQATALELKINIVFNNFVLVFEIV